MSNKNLFADARGGLTFTSSRFNVLLDLRHALLSIPVEPYRRMDGAWDTLSDNQTGCGAPGSLGTFGADAAVAQS